MKSADYPLSYSQYMKSADYPLSYSQYMKSADYPLSYVFKYCLTSDQGDLTLAAKSQQTFTSSSLPAGLASMNGAT